MVLACTVYGERRWLYRLSLGNPRESGNLRNQGQMGNNITMDFQEIGNGFMDCIELV